MKTRTNVQAGWSELNVCKNVRLVPHDRNGVSGRKVYATCPAQEGPWTIWIDAQGWFPDDRGVAWDEANQKLTQTEQRFL